MKPPQGAGARAPSRLLRRHRHRVVGAWHAVILEGAAAHLSGGGVIDAVFEQRLADALGDAAMALAFDDDRVDDSAHVINADMIHERDLPGIGVDLTGFEQMGRDLLALGDHAVRGFRECGADDDQAARTIGAPAELRAVGLAIDDVDILEGDAELSATICAKVVSCPWPWLCMPISTVTWPGGTRTVVTMEVRAGTVHALIGPNGAGKSSLLNVISGFCKASEGRGTLFGNALNNAPPYALARLGVARSFQNTEFFTQMSVLENVLVGAHPHFRSGLAETVLRPPRFHREERAARAEALKLLDVVGLSEFADEQAGNLPFGHQRRLEIARALALRPKLLLPDEPAAGLTHGEIEDLVARIRGLADRGMTIILVEHHVDMIKAVSDRVTVLDYGEVIADGPVSEMQSNPKVIEAYFGQGALPVLEGASRDLAHDERVLDAYLGRRAAARG